MKHVAGWYLVTRSNQVSEQTGGPDSRLSDCLRPEESWCEPSLCCFPGRSSAPGNPGGDRRGCPPAPGYSPEWCLSAAPHHLQHQGALSPPSATVAQNSPLRSFLSTRINMINPRKHIQRHQNCFEPALKQSTSSKFSISGRRITNKLNYSDRLFSDHLREKDKKHTTWVKFLTVRWDWTKRVRSLPVYPSSTSPRFTEPVVEAQFITLVPWRQTQNTHTNTCYVHLMFSWFNSAKPLYILYLLHVKWNILSRFGCNIDYFRLNTCKLSIY